MKSLDIQRKPRHTLRSSRPSPPVFMKAGEKSRKPWRKTVAGSAGIVVLGIVLFTVLILPEARVIVAARTEAVTRDLEISIDKNQTEPDPAGLVVPGRILEREIEGRKTYPSSGSKNVGRTASGFVSIYNFSKTTLILRAQTTVLTANGRKYFFTQDVGNIRPTALLGLTDQEVDETSLIPPVPVVAEAPGEAFNLKKAARLEIKNEVFGHQPEALYAVVAEDVSGGTTEELKVVSTADAAAALSALRQELISKARAELVKESADLRLLDKAVATQVLEEKTSAQPGEAVPEFEASAKLKLLALVYNEAHVKALITRRIERLLPENKVLLTGEPALRLESQLVNLNLDLGQGVLRNHFEGMIVYQIDRREALRKIKGRSAEEIREILLSRPEIASVEVKFYPFWVKKAPRFEKKIYFDIINEGE